MTSWLRLAGLSEPLIEALYARLVTPDCWFPYADVTRVLSRLAGAGVPVGVLSNTGWDLRDTFERYELRQHVTSFTLSCELGLEKPDPELFLAACASLGAAPERTLMVGDNPATDGGCVAAGLIGYLVPSGADHGLGAVLRIAGVQESSPDASANWATSPAR
ncbi:HAD family hydrolase [Kibdelosporangium aridum]|uniref:HAD family hydrolase n=1 Tax=Kibdelosporangium aridum TaxID=2030 RepID=UPI0035F035B0